MSGVNSHIQMPKCVLKNFVDDKQTLYHYDFASGKINPGRAASLNTEEGYYSQVVEDYLRDNIETPFGDVMKFVKDASLQDTFSVDDDFHEKIRRFFYALMSRSSEMLSSVNRNFVFFQFMPEQHQHDYAAVKGIEIAKEKGLFDGYHVTFMFNDSKVPFVLPLHGFYQFGYRQAICLNLPIAPYCAITLFDKEHEAEFVQDEMVKFLHCSDDEIIHALNKFAFITEREHNKKTIVCNQRSELEKLVQEMIHDEGKL